MQKYSTRQAASNVDVPKPQKKIFLLMLATI